MQQMRLNSKVTWGLAWAGLAVVLAVPSADYLTGAFGLKSNTAAVITSTTDPVAPVVKAPAAAPSEQKTAEVTTTVTKTGVTITPEAPVLGNSSVMILPTPIPPHASRRSSLAQPCRERSFCR